MADRYNIDDKVIVDRKEYIVLEVHSADKYPATKRNNESFNGYITVVGKRGAIKSVIVLIDGTFIMC